MGGSPTRDFERWMKGALEMERFFLKRSVPRALGEGSLLGTLEYLLRKAPDMGIFLHKGPFTSEGNLESGWGGGVAYWGL